jgi:hypothetical protein
MDDLLARGLCLVLRMNAVESRDQCSVARKVCGHLLRASLALDALQPGLFFGF